MPYASDDSTRTCLEGVLDLHLASSECPDIPVKIRRAIGLQPFQRSSEFAFEASANGRKLPLDGGFGELIHGDSEGRRGSFEIAECLEVVEVERESRAAAHGNSIHLPHRCSPGQRRHGDWTIADDGSLYTLPIRSEEVLIGRVQ